MVEDILIKGPRAHIIRLVSGRLPTLRSHKPLISNRTSSRNGPSRCLKCVASPVRKCCASPKSERPIAQKLRTPSANPRPGFLELSSDDRRGASGGRGSASLRNRKAGVGGSEAVRLA